MATDPIEIVLDGPAVLIAGVSYRLVSRPSVVPPIVPAVASPTGRNPTLIWSPARQAIWAAMLAAKHPWTTRILELGAATASYPDRGEWQVMAYQMTGDPSYAANAWAKIVPWLSTAVAAFDRNGVRENMIEDAVFYDWLTPWMSDAQRAQFAAYLHRQCEFCLAIGTPQYVGDFRVTDTDQTIGQYFGILAVDKATGSSYAAKIPPAVEPAIRGIIAHASGGIWPESSMYDNGTVRLLLMGASIAGWDVSAFAAQYGRAEGLSITPDLVDSYQWGDEQDPHSLRLFARETTLAMVGSDAVPTLAAKYPTVADQPWWRWAYFFDPAAPPRGDLAPGVLFAGGTGHFRVKTDRSLFAAHFPNRTYYDHEVPYFGDFALYLDGEWAIDRPIGYGMPATAANSMLLGGFGSMDARAATGWASDGTAHRISGTTSGLAYALPYYDPPPPFLQGWTRTIVFIEPSTIVVHDKVAMVDPTAMPNASRYQAADIAAMVAGPAQRWILHTPTPATIAAGTASWETPKGKTVTVHTLLPSAPIAAVVDESTLYGTNCVASEKRFHLSLSGPASTTEWLSVISVGDAPACTVDPAGVVVNGRLVGLQR